MMEESLASSSPTPGLIARKTFKISAISDPDAGGCVATGFPLLMERAKSMSTILMNGAILLAYSSLKDEAFFPA